MTGTLKSLIDSDLYAILAWKSTFRTLKYFILALFYCVLNVIWGVSVTVLVLTTVMSLRGPRIYMNLRAARRAEKAQEDDTNSVSKEEREKIMRQEAENSDLNLISE